MSATARWGYTLRRAAAALGRRPWRFLMGIVASAIAIALVLIVAAIGFGVAPQLARLMTGPQINVFVAVGTAQRDLDALRGRLSALPGAPAIVLIPRDQALAELTKRAGAPAELRGNPLPDVLVAQYAIGVEPAIVEQAATAIRDWPGVERVLAEAGWYQRLHAVVLAAGIAAAVAGVAAGLLAVFALVVAAAAQVQLSAAEAAILRTAGASKAFIVRPHACAAALTLALGGVLALALLAVVLNTAEPRLTAAAQALGPRFDDAWWASLPVWSPLAVVVLAAVFGRGVGALAARRRMASAG